MKKWLFFFFFIGSLSILSAQNEDSLKSSRNIFFSIKNCYSSNSNLEILQPIKSIGINSILPLLVNRKFITCGIYELAFILPEKRYFFDTLRTTIRGYNLGLTFLGYDLFNKNRNFDLITSFGVNMGRIKLIKNELTHQKNSFFAPKVELVSRVFVGRFAIFAAFNIDYDISNPNWVTRRNSTIAQINLGNFQNSGFSINFGIGYSFRGKE
jgi:hypothetical protein